MSGQTQPGTALQALAEKLRTDAIAIFGEGQAERDIIEWFYIAMLAAAQSAPAGEQPAPYGWVAAGQFFTGRESAVNAAGKTPCVEVYSRPQVLAILARSAERQALAEELARLLKQSGDEFRALKSAPVGEREALSAFTAWGESVGLSPALQTVGELKAFKAGAEWQARAALSPARENVREWIPVSERLPADSRDVLVYCSDTDEHMVGSSMGCGRFAFAYSERGTRICCRPSHWRYIDEGDKPAALAASTEQEVKP